MRTAQATSEGALRPAFAMARGRLLLGVDTCGPAGWVALGRLADELTEIEGNSVEILEQIELEGRNYSATLIASVRGLLDRARAGLAEIAAIVVVNGPGSFTGVRVGLSAVKGLAQPARIPVIAISRLEVLAWKAGTRSSALDAHRHEIFLRLDAQVDGEGARELLAGTGELAGLKAGRIRVAVCDGAAADLLKSAAPALELVHAEPPSAADALRLGLQSWSKRSFAPLELLDGHYLRRSDAEIFGDKKAQAR